jgi:hypothetical protein
MVHNRKMSADAPLPIDNPEDEAYVSEEDEDFAPGDDNVSSGSDSDDEKTKQQATPSKSKAQQAAPKSRDDVGKIAQDEVEGLYQDAGKKRRRGEAEAEDSGGEGGLVQTRSMAAAQQDSGKKPLASVTGATVDVEAMWKAMNSADFGPVRTASTPEPSPSKNASAGAPRPTESPSKPTPSADPDSEMVEVTEKYEFAGEIHTKTTLVPRSSIKTTDPPAATQKRGPDGALLYRPLRRISAFEPNPQGMIRGLPRAGGDNSQARKDSKNKNKAPRHSHIIPRVKQPKKLNVVDKSKLDWQVHVEETGQRDELEAAKKEKGAFLDRRDFLERVEGREEDRRVAARTR